MNPLYSIVAAFVSFTSGATQAFAAPAGNPDPRQTHGTVFATGRPTNHSMAHRRASGRRHHHHGMVKHQHRLWR